MQKRVADLGSHRIKKSDTPFSLHLEVWRTLVPTENKKRTQVTAKLGPLRMPWGGPQTAFVHRRLSAAELACRVAVGAEETAFDGDQALGLHAVEEEGSMDSLALEDGSTASESSELRVGRLL